MYGAFRPNLYAHLDKRFTTKSALETSSLDELLLRMLEIAKAPSHRQQNAEALLGTVETTSLPISEVLKLYFEKLAIGTQIGKSEAQRKNWRKPKMRSVQNFIDLVGDLDMHKITRAHARDLYNWWGERIAPKDGKKRSKSE